MKPMHRLLISLVFAGIFVFIASKKYQPFLLHIIFVLGYFFCYLYSYGMDNFIYPYHT